MDPFLEREHQNLRPLPEGVETLLRQMRAPQRLAAHLLLVHDVVAQILDGLKARGLAADIDAPAVLFGAATHDIGKALFPNELDGPGKEHERAGRELLIRTGIAPQLARFAETHGQPLDTPGLTIDDYLVKLADTCWKGVRYMLLEERIAADRMKQAAVPQWDVFLAVDGLVEEITAEADRRLAWQALFPV